MRASPREGRAHQQRPAPPKISHQQAADRDQHSATDRHTVVLLPVASLVAALDLLDELGLCACWIGRPWRRCRGGGHRG